MRVARDNWRRSPPLSGRSLTYRSNAASNNSPRARAPSRHEWSQQTNITRRGQTRTASEFRGFWLSLVLGPALPTDLPSRVGGRLHPRRVAGAHDAVHPLELGLAALPRAHPHRWTEPTRSAALGARPEMPRYEPNVWPHEWGGHWSTAAPRRGRSWGVAGFCLWVVRRHEVADRALEVVPAESSREGQRERECRPRDIVLRRRLHHHARRLPPATRAASRRLDRPRAIRWPLSGPGLAGLRVGTTRGGAAWPNLMDVGVHQPPPKRAVAAAEREHGGRLDQQLGACVRDQRRLVRKVLKGATQRSGRRGRVRCACTLAHSADGRQGGALHSDRKAWPNPT